MARPPMTLDEEERIKRRLQLGNDALGTFVKGGDEHPYARAGATATDQASKTKKPFKARKAEEDKLVKKQVRLHPKVIEAIERFGDKNKKDFSEAARDLLGDGLERNGVEVI